MDIEVQSVRDSRRGILIARFEDGYAAGWKMAVPEAFRDALDIMRQEKSITVKTDDVSGSSVFKAAQWTQGNNYSFRSGDTLFDCRSPGGAWSDLVKILKIGVKVIEAGSGEWVKAKRNISTVEETRLSWSPKAFFPDNKEGIPEIAQLNVEWLVWKPGFLKFQVFRPNSDRTTAEFGEIYDTDQDLFVTFLQTGVLWRKGNKPIDFFR